MKTQPFYSIPIGNVYFSMVIKKVIAHHDIPMLNVTYQTLQELLRSEYNASIQYMAGVKSQDPTNHLVFTDVADFTQFILMFGRP